MTTTHDLYHYIECGLQNIWLKNGFIIEEMDSEKTVAIEDLDGLHRAIGIEICRHRFISGDEFRFLRKELDMSQSKLGEILGVSENSIANWERNSSIPKAAIALLKGLYFEKINQNYTLSYVTEHTANTKKKVEMPKMEFFEENGCWLKKAA